MPKKLFYLLFFFTLLFSFIDFSNAQQSVAPAVPVIIEPKEGEEVSTLTPVISWLASERADVYSWLVYDVKDLKIVAFSTTRATTAYMPPYKLEWGKSYKLWVTACSLPQNGNLCSQFSERNFKVKPQNSLKVLIPNGGEVWQEGTTQKISWQDDIVVPQSNVLPPPVSYDIDLISYYYQPDNSGGGSPSPGGLSQMVGYKYKIARSVPGFSYDWSVGKVLDEPRIPHGSYIIQVCRTNTNICDSSDKPFQVVSQPSNPVITVISPNGGETLIHDNFFTISWKSINAPKNSYVELRRIFSIEGGSSEVIATNLPPTGSFRWRVQMKGGGEKIEGVDMTGDRSWSGYIKAQLYPSLQEEPIKDMNDKPFRINTLNDKPLYVKVKSPNGGETLIPGKTYNIEWISSEVPSDATIQIGFRPITRDSELGDDIIVKTTNRQRSYSWTVPTNVQPGKYRVSVSYINRMGTYTSYDYSDQPFTIISFPSLTVLSPNGGEVLEQGKTYEIKWLTQQGSEPNLLPGPYVRIELWKGGKYLRTLFSMTPNDSKELWTVPKNLKDGRDYRIKIIDLQRRIFDFSDADFTITSSPVSLSNSSLIRQLENQAASLSEALFELIESLKNLK